MVSNSREVAVFHESAGALVMLNGRVVVVRRGPEWILPKGHLEAGETPVTAALREVREETGLEIKVVAELGATRYGFSTINSPTRHRKKVHWFLAAAIGGQLLPERPHDKVMAVTPARALQMLTHADHRALVERARDLAWALIGDSPAPAAES